MYDVKIVGTGKALPEFELTNEAISTFVETSDEWIESRTGIKSRYIALEESTTQLASTAARQALKQAKVDANKIDLIIVATVTPEYRMPSTACLVAEALEITNATCFDISAACSGFIYASEVACSLLTQGNYQNALVIGAETLSQVVNWEDRNTCVLFSDGAGAVVYAKNDAPKIMNICTHSNGTGSELITLRQHNQTNRFHAAKHENKFIEMNGKEVYKFATTIIPHNIEEVLVGTPYGLEDIDWFILHQANERIIDSVAKKLGISSEKFFKNVKHHGNTSAASIPMALADIQDQLKSGDKIILSGFGSGLTWGSMLIIWD